MSKKMCEVCHKNTAEVPDRERMGRPINRICRECHAKRLRGDMGVVVEVHDMQHKASGETE